MYKQLNASFSTIDCSFEVSEIMAHSCGYSDLSFIFDNPLHLFCSFPFLPDFFICFHSILIFLNTIVLKFDQNIFYFLLKLFISILHFVDLTLSIASRIFHYHLNKFAFISINQYSFFNINPYFQKPDSAYLQPFIFILLVLKSSLKNIIILLLYSNKPCSN